MVMKISGRASASAAISVMTVIIDMLADLFLIYGLAGIPRLGIAGCAISTVVVEACAFIVCVVDSYGKTIFVLIEVHFSVIRQFSIKTYQKLRFLYLQAVFPGE